MNSLQTYMMNGKSNVMKGLKKLSAKLQFKQWKKQDEFSSSVVQSQVTTAQATHGQKPIDVLNAAYDYPFAIQSNFARAYSGTVAACASLGLITSILPDGTPTREWRITEKGIKALHMMEKEYGIRN